MDFKFDNQRNNIIAKLIETRTQAGITQQELADRIGTKKSAISRIENGQQNLSIDMLIKISEALGKKVEFNLADAKSDNMYELRIFDEPLMKLSLENKGLEGLVCDIRWINENKIHLMPLDMQITGKGVVKWLESRVIPKNRKFVDEILKTLGLSHNDTKGIIDVCKGLSLNDSYWIVPEGFNGKFAEYNLYENSFSDILSLVAYTGQGQSAGVFTTSPELTTNGMLPKAWRFKKSGIYLYKGGTSGAANAGNEPYSEYYACQIAKKMGINCVKYNLENWKGILASTCKIFTDINTSYIPIGRIVREGGLKACIDYYSDELGEDAVEQLKSMLVFDSLIYNEDRHFGNFGVLRDNSTGKVIEPAPIFDNGISLFNYAMPDDFKNIEEYAKTRMSAYNIDFDEIFLSVAGKKQIAQLRKLIGFTFKRHKSLNLPEERLVAIEDFIQKRVRHFLAIYKTNK